MKQSKFTDVNIVKRNIQINKLWLESVGVYEKYPGFLAFLYFTQNITYKQTLTYEHICSSNQAFNMYL